MYALVSAPTPSHYVTHIVQQYRKKSVQSEATIPDVKPESKLSVSGAAYGVGRDKRLQFF